MVKKMSVHVDEKLQNDFKNIVKQKHNRVKGIYGNEVGNAMKLYLTLQGGDSYSDDPDVQELLRLSREIPCTHTQSKKEPNVGHHDHESSEDRMQRLEEKFEQLQDQLAENVSQNPPKNGRDNYRDNDVDVKREIKEIKEKLAELINSTQKGETAPSSKRELKERIRRHKQVSGRRARERKEKRSGPMDMFARIFREEYGDWRQVSYNEISNLAVETQGVTDKRSINNRITYLQGVGIIENHAPKVYNVKI